MNPALCCQATTNVSFEGKYNLGQNIVEKSAKLSKIGFSIECFTDAFLSFSCTFVKFCLLGSYLLRSWITREATRAFTF